MIAVVDGQGGGIGKSLVEKLRNAFGEKTEIMALGTNAAATSMMLKAGASEGATGENAIAVNVRKADYIVGTIGIIAANSMLGELTPKMAEAISESPAKKVLVPLSRCNLYVAGLSAGPLPRYIDNAVEIIRSFAENETPAG